uniref:Uncharacterized protein n=1 Tax=Lepeophtheirus salmonis TaxID=72036 RepID=A0A0K2TPW3_LEPSM
MALMERWGSSSMISLIMLMKVTSWTILLLFSSFFFLSTTSIESYDSSSCFLRFLTVLTDIERRPEMSALLNFM